MPRYHPANRTREHEDARTKTFRLVPHQRRCAYAAKVPANGNCCLNVAAGAIEVEKWRRLCCSQALNHPTQFLDVGCGNESRNLPAQAIRASVAFMDGRYARKYECRAGEKNCYQPYSQVIASPSDSSLISASPHAH